jgi:uracil-DNA glycosylase
VLALGKLAFDQSAHLLRERGYEIPRISFGHNACQELRSENDRPIHLMGSYHPSRQNTQTGRLTDEMLDDVFRHARSLLDSG